MRVASCRTIHAKQILHDENDADTLVMPNYREELLELIRMLGVVEHEIVNDEKCISVDVIEKTRGSSLGMFAASIP